jgi:hypothetical protein
MSQTEQTLEEVSDSLTGFDEIAIAQQFGRNVADLAQHDPSMFSRTLLFVVKRRAGLSDEEAKNAALGMTMKECADFFAETSQEEPGKDEPSEEQPGTSLSSVS